MNVVKYALKILCYIAASYGLNSVASSLPEMYQFTHYQAGTVYGFSVMISFFIIDAVFDQIPKK